METLMKEVWHYYTLQAKCIQCKLDITIESGTFSILLTHLKLEHNIILEHSSDGERVNAFDEAFAEEETLVKTENDSDNECVTNSDHIEEEKDSKPIGIQILKFKNEDENRTVQFMEEFYGNVCNKGDKREDEKEEQNSGSEGQLKRNNIGKHTFNKFDYFDESTENNNLNCKFCEETFPENDSTHKTRLRKLKKHLLSTHREQINSSIAEFLTNQIGNDVKRNNDYKQRIKGEKEEVFDKFHYFDQSHEDEATSEMICKYCGERFPNNSSRYNRMMKLKKHMYNLHKDKLTLSLAGLLRSQIENSTNQRRKYLEMNKERTKLQRKEYKIKNREAIRENSKRLYNRKELDPETGKLVRLRTLMNNARRQFHKCHYDGCTKDFESNWKLEAHIRTHTGEKPFICSDCGKRFNMEKHLQAHKRVHSDEAMFQCKYCDKRYKNPSGVKKHLKEGRGCEGLKMMQTKGFPIPEHELKS